MQWHTTMRPVWWIAFDGIADSEREADPLRGRADGAFYRRTPCACSVRSVFAAQLGFAIEDAHPNRPSVTCAENLAKDQCGADPGGTGETGDIRSSGGDAELSMTPGIAGSDPAGVLHHDGDGNSITRITFIRWAQHTIRSMQEIRADRVLRLTMLLPRCGETGLPHRG